MTKEASPIPLLSHHVRVMIPFWLETETDSLSELISNFIIPHLESVVINQQRMYMFLENPVLKQTLITGLSQAITAYLANDFIEIPDIDPLTHKPNTDFICDHCGNNRNGRCKQLDEI